MEPAHTPVLYHEIIHALRPKSGGLYIEGTVGAGGHARGILEACAPTGRLIGFDLDPQALELAREFLAPYGQRVRLIQASYILLEKVLVENDSIPVDGILLDLGISSLQLGIPVRGFSFLNDGPLDMRFSPTNPTTAADLVNNLAEEKLADILFRFGEERKARRIAQAVVQARPLYTTHQLVKVIESVSPRSGKYHPATRTFQALRIAVNEELDSVEKVLPQAIRVLKSGGRLAVIAFHSLEDRLVKEFFRRESRECICPPRQPICNCGHKASIREITRRPIKPTAEEILRNSRARSAKLRVAEKL